MDDALRVFGMMMAVVTAGGTAFVIYSVVNAVTRRLQGGGARSDEVAAELEDLRGRLSELEAAHDRMLELEERMDFAERLLAKTGTNALEPPR